MCYLHVYLSVSIIWLIVHIAVAVLADAAGNWMRGLTSHSFFREFKIKRGSENGAREFDSTDAENGELDRRVAKTTKSRSIE